MSVQVGSQNYRILRALEGGAWTTVPKIHRRAGSSRLNSRIHELRDKHGYDIECERVAGRKGAGAYRYRLLGGPPIPPDPTATLAQTMDGYTLEAEAYAPRDERNRYRLYVLPHGSDEPSLIATCPSPEAVGVALVTLAEEGEFKLSCVGLMDTHGREDVNGTWILNPFEPGAF